MLGSQFERPTRQRFNEHVFHTNPVLNITDNITDLSASSFHTCVTVDTGGAKCWGSGGSGRLGTGNAASTNTPLDVIDVTTATAIAASSENTCVLLDDGGIKCWGSRALGQVGDGTVDRVQITAIDLPDIDNAKAISAGSNHFCALLDDENESVTCWGENRFGQTGYAITNQSTEPLTVPGLPAVAQVATGDNHTCARLTDNTLRCWGEADTGVLGNNLFYNTDEVVTVLDINTAIDIDAGRRNTCAVLSDGSAKCWGSGSSGQIGNGTNNLLFRRPETVSNISEATQISIGTSTVCAVIDPADVTIPSSAMCWGAGGVGNLGNGQNNASNVPVAVQNVTNVIEIDVGNNHACVNTSSLGVFCWGAGGAGQLGYSISFGDPAFENSNIPVDTQGGLVKRVGTGAVHSCAIQNDGQRQMLGG